MKNVNLTKAGLALFSLAACTHIQATSVDVENTAGRIVEFKSDANGYDTKSYFYIGRSEVVAFDAQFTPDLAKQSIAELRKVTKKPIRYLVITHPNPDKFNGASVFKAEGAKIVASRRTEASIPGVHAYKEYFFVEMAKMFPRGSYPQPVAVDESFDSEMEILLSDGEKIRLIELGTAGVSSNQTLALIPRTKTLIVGDLIHHRAHAWLEGPIVGGQATPDLDQWIRSLETLKKQFSADLEILAGRGDRAKLGDAVVEQIRYLKKARDLVKQDITQRGALAREYQGAKSAQLYGELAKRFEAAFPDYKLAYMIQYGAYGLVNQILAQRN